MELKTWAATTKWNENLAERVTTPAKQMLVCTGRPAGAKCPVRNLAPKAYTPIQGLKMGFKAYLLVARCWSSQKRIDQTAHDLKGFAGEDQNAWVSALRDISGWYVCNSTKMVVFTTARWTWMGS